MMSGVKYQVLDNKIELINNDDTLLDMVLESDAIYYWSCNNKFKPKINIWYDCLQINETKKIENYSLWLQFYCDYIGYNINIFYPLNTKKGDSIKVIFEGENIKGYVSWVHGVPGLFWSKLILLLFLEKYKYNKYSKEIKNKLSLL